MSNPFFDAAPENGVPEFDRIALSHYGEAFDKAFRQQDDEIQAIIDNPEAPTFLNSIEALISSITVSVTILIYFIIQ